MVHALEGEDTFEMGDATDRRQPLHYRVYPVKSVSMVHALEGEDTFEMGDATDRRQPLHYRVSPVKSVSMVHPLEGEDTFDLIAVNRYTIVCLLLHEEHCTLSRGN